MTTVPKTRGRQTAKRGGAKKATQESDIEKQPVVAVEQQVEEAPKTRRGGRRAVAATKPIETETCDETAKTIEGNTHTHTNLIIYNFFLVSKI